MLTPCWPLLTMIRGVKRLDLAVLHAQQAQESNDCRAVIRHELKFRVELLRLIE